MPWGPSLIRIPTRYIVAPYNPKEGTSQEDYARKIEEIRVKAALIQDPYFQFCAFYKLAEVTGDVEDLNGCYRAASKMKIKDSNEYLFQLVKISIAMEELDFAKKTANKIRHTVKKKYAKDLIAKAGKNNIKDDGDVKSTKVSKKTSSKTTKK